MDDAALQTAETPLPPAGGIPRLSLDVSATPQDVRNALIGLRRTLTDWGIGAEDRGTAEMVLAEVMNNIVEHALAEDPDAVLRLALWHHADGLQVQVDDRGLPMPGGQLPEGRQHDLNVGIGDLPEGGFGWALIRQATQDLTYQRRDGENLLRFRLPLTAPD